jgi:DNA-binding XRE family transcriptional regulator
MSRDRLVSPRRPLLSGWAGNPSLSLFRLLVPCAVFDDGNIASCYTCIKRLDELFFRLIFVGMNGIGSVVREARQALGMSQRELARLLDIAPPYLADLETGRRNFPLARIAALPDRIRLAALEYRCAQLAAALEETESDLAELERRLARAQPE